MAAVLHLIGIDVQVFHAHLTTIKRTQTTALFNESHDQCMVLVCSYSVNSAGMNLQHMCQNVHLFDTPLSEAITLQAIDYRSHLQNWPNTDCQGL